jgi:3',5'-cyclic AMP phosphodiesterase CpdA
MVSLLQISDSHIVAREPSNPTSSSLAEAVRVISGRTTTAALETVLERIGSVGFNPRLIVHTGDVVDTPDAASYEVAAHVLERMGVPTLAVSGNHDDPIQLAAAFGEIRSYESDGWLIVLLDSRIGGAKCGRVGQDTLAWLDEQLSSTDAHVLIGLHHPPLSVCGDPDCRLLDSHEMLDAIDRHPNVRGVISGHLHLADEIRDEKSTTYCPLRPVFSSDTVIPCLTTTGLRQGLAQESSNYRKMAAFCPRLFGRSLSDAGVIEVSPNANAAPGAGLSEPRRNSPLPRPRQLDERRLRCRRGP